jgi:hypothetical protein
LPSSSRLFGEREKNATSDADIKADRQRSKAMDIRAKSKLILKYDYTDFFK